METSEDNLNNVDSEVSDEELPSFALAATVWWSIAWRLLLALGVGAYAVGYIAGRVLVMVGWMPPVDRVVDVLTIGLSVALVPVHILLLRTFMTRGFGRYRLAVVKR